MPRDPRSIWTPEDGDKPPPAERNQVAVEGFIARDVVPLNHNGAILATVHMEGMEDGQPRIIAFEIENFMGMVALAAKLNGLELVPKGIVGEAIWSFASTLATRKKSIKIGGTEAPFPLHAAVLSWAEKFNVDLAEQDRSGDAWKTRMEQNAKAHERPNAEGSDSGEAGTDGNDAGSNDGEVLRIVD
jgi:hypothetical protein